MSEGVSVSFVTRVDWDAPINEDYEPRILPDAIKLRERFNQECRILNATTIPRLTPNEPT
jgi:hypothetical protein